MPDLASHQSSHVTKMLLLGDSGAGKTGSLASLAKAGFKLRILDLESGLDVLANLLRDKSGPYGPTALANVTYETLTDRMKKAGDKLIPAKASVWSRVCSFLDNWGKQALIEAQRRARECGEDPTKVVLSEDVAKLGHIADWGPQDVLVIDSLSALSKAALNNILAMNARLGQQPHQSDWYQGQQLIENLLEMMYDESVRCNIIVIAHIKYIGDEGGPSQGYPNTLGKALPPNVGRYFNSALMARSSGSGNNIKRQIHTNTAGMVELKNTAPLTVRAVYPLQSGLADYFAAVRST